MCDYLKLHTTILISSFKLTKWRVITNEPRRDKHEQKSVLKVVKKKGKINKNKHSIKIKQIVTWQFKTRQYQ